MRDDALEGARILVTRPESRSHELRARLAAAGAQVISAPTIMIEAASHAQPEQLAVYDLVVFTSVSAVEHFLLDAELPAGIRIAAVGPATAQAIRALGHTAAVINDGVTSAELVQTLGPITGRRILLPRGDRADPHFAEALEQAGAVVDAVTVYRTVSSAPPAASLPEIERGADLIVFYSPSAVAGFVQGTARRFPSVCVGPTTAAAAGSAGFEPVAVAAAPTTDAVFAEATRLVTRLRAAANRGSEARAQ